MASKVSPQLLQELHRTIAATPNGLDAEQLAARINRNPETVRQVARMLVAAGLVEIQKDVVPGVPGAAKNIYVSTQPPEPTTAELQATIAELRERLTAITAILEPFQQAPVKYDAGWKTEFHYQIRAALAVAVGRRPDTK